MSAKGTELTTESKYKISVSRSRNRKEIEQKLKEYIGILLDPNEKNQIPSIVSASLYAGMSKKALLAWELQTAENSEVRICLEFIRDLEEQYLRDMGLLKLLNGKLVATLLEAEHGIKKDPQNLTQNNIFNISPELLAEAMALSRSAKKPKPVKA